MLYVNLIVFTFLVVLLVATVIHESILKDSQGSGRNRGTGRDLTSFSLCCAISALSICMAGWLLNL